MTTALQLRGHCQCCGRLQAVTRGVLAHHGYEVAGYGYFKGTCTGHQHEPIEVFRGIADQVIAAALADAVDQTEQANAIRDGEIKPRSVATGEQTRDAAGKWVDVIVPFAEASLYHQERACAKWADQCEMRARGARAFSKQLQAVVDAYHGKPLTEVPKAEAPAAIPAGERRVLNPKNGTVGTVRYVERGRVEYSYTNSLGQTFSPSMATRSWRNLPRVTEAGAA